MLDPGGVWNLPNAWTGQVFLLLWSSQDYSPVLLMHWCMEWQNQNKTGSCLGRDEESWPPPP